MVRLEDGQEFPVCLDTGSSGTLLDESLAPKLGKRLGTRKIGIFDSPGKEEGIYSTPKLYLGNVPLLTGSRNGAYDFKGWDIKGIIGMNCLKHYCIQLDFQAHKIRFLDPNNLDVSNLGKAYPITFARTGRPFIRHGSFIGGNSTNAQTDVAFAKGDRPKTRELPVTYALIDSGWDPSDGRVDGAGKPLHLAECTWDGQTYTNIVIHRGKDANLIGLKFLARHLVTLNFPKRVLYLKQTSVGPLKDEDKVAAWKFFVKCARQKGGLPGNPPHAPAYIYRTMSEWPADTFECVIHQEKDPTHWHYLIARASSEAPWKLQRAWQTGEMGKNIKEYPVP